MIPVAVTAQNDVQTHRQYLSGHGCDDMVEWDFMCTGGRNSGRWTKIGVPSCWELQGFGTYQYGMRFYGKANPEGIADEKGLYKYEFTLPKEWEGRHIELVFEAAMTDARVTINGRKAGDGLHQGGFYRFVYDVSDRIFFGSKKNRLEVEVAKESANSQVNMAERRADYWNFGGIFRPVFVVSKPAENIDRVAIDARADGNFRCEAYLNRAVSGATVTTEIRDLNGKTVARNTTDTRSSDVAHIDFAVANPRLWTAETPNRYEAVFTLKDAKGRTLHVEREKFGFRTIEYRASDGVYINGHKVIFKGVNRHSFRPESGRTLSKAKNIEDVELIKSMNMNAVRLSHYPADPEFLDACDSLGLYVESELSGWHFAHETIVGQRLVREMITRDQNHPSIIFWSNGNEGGFNYELEPEFARWDLQKRVVLYPWANRNGFETKHYRSYGETEEYMRQKEIFLPTEFLHGLYDGGHGAGLEDYWNMMMANPRCAGGFLWDLADEGVVRTDMNGIVDCMGNFGADGIVGPHFEREGSYYTIKDVWSPVGLSAGMDDREIRVANTYDFTNLKDCRFTYRYLKMPEPGGTTVKTLGSGTLKSPDVEPGGEGVLELPAIPSGVNCIEIKATDRHGKEIITKTFHEEIPMPVDNPVGDRASIHYARTDSIVSVTAADRMYSFSNTDGRLMGVSLPDRQFSLSNGPRLVAARRSDRSFDQFYNHDDKDAEKKKTQYTLYDDQGSFSGFTWDGYNLTAHYDHGSLDSVVYAFYGRGSSFGDGSVSVLAYYHFGGVVDLMGVAFDYPETKVRSKSWVGDGPYRVWQNRLRGPQFGYWQNEYNDPIPGESWDYPEFKGYFSGVDWMRIVTDEGAIRLSGLSFEQEFADGNIATRCPYVGVYTPRDGRDHLLYTLPETGLAVLPVIPAVRNKVNTTDLNGPSAQPRWVSGPAMVSFTLSFE